MRSPRLVLVTGLMIGTSVFAADMLAQKTADPMAGTWHLNIAKSKYSPGPAPKSVVLTFESTPQGTHAISEVALADGRTMRQEFTAKDDGVDVPLKGSTIADTATLKVDGNKRIRTDKKGGKVVMTYIGTLSADGKTFSVEQKGTNDKGEAVNNHLVFEKH